jgi:Lrp/AsnC family transcriptional regulator, regulator for asnA, asnC and gidA
LIPSIDESDIQIIKQLIKGYNNKEISSKLHIPLSTVQRRTKRILEQELVTSTIRLNRYKFGYRTGLIHIYCTGENIQQTAKKVLEFGGVTSVEVHIGNSDILADFAYKESNDLYNVILKIKQMGGIERVVWSERISRLEERDYDLLLNN